MLARNLPSLIRTAAAAVVGYLLSLPLAHPVLELLGMTEAAAAAKEKAAGALVVLLTAAYYALVRVLEQRWPQLTWLLGSNQQPVSYAPATDGTPVVTSLHETGLIPPHVDLNGELASSGSHAAPTDQPATAVNGPTSPTGGTA